MKALSLAAAGLLLSAGLAMAQSDLQQKPRQLDKQPVPSGTEAGTSTPQPGDAQSRAVTGSGSSSGAAMGAKTTTGAGPSAPGMKKPDEQKK
ncbi:MAG TPA: hypothetical protein VNR11_10205 [Xanthobacteraceae bacterium]|nr:hypothetical protein [Xanthobacteraceae bacterium]